MADTVSIKYLGITMRKNVHGVFEKSGGPEKNGEYEVGMEVAKELLTCPQVFRQVGGESVIDEPEVEDIVEDDETPEDYSNWTVGDLKTHLASNGIAVERGTKKAGLIELAEAYDAEQSENEDEGDDEDFTE